MPGRRDPEPKPSRLLPIEQQRIRLEREVAALTLLVGLSEEGVLELMGSCHCVTVY